MLATTLLIQELGGNPPDFVGDFSVELGGRALPYKPFELTGTQRAEVTFYQGNPVGSAQVIGPEEKPTRLAGMWKNRFIYDTEGPDGSPDALAGIKNAKGFHHAVDVMDLVKTIDLLRMRGKELRVTWDEITRVGILTSFTQRWLERQDCEWEMEFTWLSQGQSQGALGATEDALNLSLIAKMRAAMDKITDAVSTGMAYVNMTQDYIADVQSAVTRVGSAVTGAINATQNVAAFTQGLPDHMKQAVVAKCQEARNASQALADTVSSKPTRSTVSPIYSSADSQGLVWQGTVVTAAASQQQVVLAAKAMARFCAQQQQTLLQQLNTPLQAVVYSKQGQDLRAISMVVYGSSDQAQMLKTVNRLSTTMPPKGTLILCPQLTEGGTA